MAPPLVVLDPIGAPLGSIYHSKTGFRRLCKIDDKFRWALIPNPSPGIKKEKRRLKKKARKERRDANLLLELCDLATSAGFSNAPANAHNDPNIL
jgi:hypothetical protein